MRDLTLGRSQPSGGKEVAFLCVCVCVKCVVFNNISPIGIVSSMKHSCYNYVM